METSEHKSSIYAPNMKYQGLTLQEYKTKYITIQM